MIFNVINIKFFIYYFLTEKTLFIFFLKEKINFLLNLVDNMIYNYK